MRSRATWVLLYEYDNESGYWSLHRNGLGLKPYVEKNATAAV